MYEPYCGNYTHAVDIMLTVEQNLMVRSLSSSSRSRCASPGRCCVPKVTEPSLPSRLLLVITRRTLA